MITMMATKGDEQKAQRSKNNSRESRTIQEFKNQEEFKTQDSRMKKRLNQDKY